MRAVDDLATELVAAYPSKRRKSLSPRDGLAFVEAQRYVRSLAMKAYRLIKMENSAAFDGSYRFQGKNVAELLKYMTSTGLEFAPPEPGGELTYRKLYNSIRNTYLRLVPKPNAREEK